EVYQIIIFFRIIFLIYTSVLSYQFLPERELFYSPINLQRTYTPKLEEVPHHVLIIYSNLFCSGSLVSSITVVTAASCFWKNTDEKVMVKIGSNILSDGENIYNVDSIKIHEYYKHLCDTDNDIALLLLKGRRLFDNGGPAIYQDLLVGILSFGNAEPKEPYLAVFTNISYFYRFRNGAIRRNESPSKTGTDKKKSYKP
ncbi:Trypsin, partial [Papilio xuthus]